MNKRKRNTLKLIVFDETLITKKKKKQMKDKLFQAAAVFWIKHQNESIARQGKERHSFPFDEEVSEVPLNTVPGASAFVSNLLSAGT